MASFQSQYGIRLSRDLSGMKWAEFQAFIIGLDNQSPLGRIISIRAEDDPQVLKQYTKGQRRIRNEWRSRKAKTMPQKDVDQFMSSMKEVFSKMFEPKTAPEIAPAQKSEGSDQRDGPAAAEEKDNQYVKE